MRCESDPWSGIKILHATEQLSPHVLTWRKSTRCNEDPVQTKENQSRGELEQEGVVKGLRSLPVVSRGSVKSLGCFHSDGELVSGPVFHIMSSGILCIIDNFFWESELNGNGVFFHFAS